MASKSKKSKPKAEKKKSSRAKSAKPKHGAIGHNGKVNEALVEILDTYMSMEEDKKQIGKSQRDLRAKAKTEHGVESAVFNHEIKLRKMDSDRRAMFEQGHSDLKDMTGYQMALQLSDNSGDDDDARDPEEAAADAAAA